MKINSIKNSVLFILAIFIISCGKKSEPVAEPEKPTNNLIAVTAAADNNTKSGGVYKGVLVGSTGSIKVILQQDLKSVYILFDGVEKILTTTSLNNWSSGQAINGAVFTNGDWKVEFWVNTNGSDPILKVTIPGHTVKTEAVKETSVSQTTAFEGKFTANNKSNTFNFVVKGTDTLAGTILNTDTKTVYLGGKVFRDTVKATAFTTTGIMKVIGVIKGNNASGTFTETGGTGSNAYTLTGTWAAVKSF